MPGRLAVTGYDDIDAASRVSPALTTVVNPAREIGPSAARL
ncbi:substrate-binding domain-containing protein [Streptomyces sp. E5N298]|nr:substrate-binding domain-containing protein [Streptomyces sp. E5N298]